MSLRIRFRRKPQGLCRSARCGCPSCRGSINVLVGVQPLPARARILHYTLGGPWFDDCRDMALGDQWLAARAAMNDAAPTAPKPDHKSLYNASVV